MTLSASKLQLAEQCQHWLTLDWEDKPGPAAIEGTRRHKLIERYLRAEKVECDEQWFETWRKHTERQLPDGDMWLERAFALHGDFSVQVLGESLDRDYSQAPPDSLVGTSDLVVVAPDTEVDEAALIEHCRDRLAHYKCPTSVEFRPELARTATGKLQKFKLRAPY